MATRERVESDLTREQEAVTGGWDATVEIVWNGKGRKAVAQPGEVGELDRPNLDAWTILSLLRMHASHLRVQNFPRHSTEIAP